MAPVGPYEGIESLDRTTWAVSFVGVMLQTFFIASIYGLQNMVCSDLIGSYGIKDVLEKYKLFRILNHTDLLSRKGHEAIGSCKLLHADLWTA